MLLESVVLPLVGRPRAIQLAHAPAALKSTRCAVMTMRLITLPGATYCSLCCTSYTKPADMEKQLVPKTSHAWLVETPMTLPADLCCPKVSRFGRMAFLACKSAKAQHSGIPWLANLFMFLPAGAEKWMDIRYRQLQPMPCAGNLTICSSSFFIMYTCSSWFPKLGYG